MKKKIAVAVLVVLTVTLGFLRDYIFVSINKFIESGNDVDGRLALLKWVLTALFSILYLLVTGTFLHFLFRERKYVILTIFCYSGLVFVAFLAGLTGYIFSSYEGVYPFIRAILGVAQSPVLLMILIPIAYFELKRK